MKFTKTSIICLLTICFLLPLNISASDWKELQILNVDQISSMTTYHPFQNVIELDVVLESSRGMGYFMAIIIMTPDGRKVYEDVRQSTSITISRKKLILRTSNQHYLANGNSLSVILMRAHVKKALVLNSPVCSNKDIIRAAYCRVLERPAINVSRYCEWDAKSIVTHLAKSWDHQYWFGSNNPNQYVQKLYDHLLARGARSDEIQYWVNQYNNHRDWSPIVDGFVNSVEYGQRFGNNKVPGDGRHNCK